jgi:hypothetical protein
MSAKTGVALLCFLLCQYFAFGQFGNKFALEFEPGKPIEIQFDEKDGNLYLLSPEQKQTVLKLYPAQPLQYPATQRRVGVVDPQNNNILFSYGLEPIENYLLANMHLHQDLPAEARYRPLYIVEMYDNNGDIQRNVLARVQINQ